MLAGRKIVADTFCEIYDLIQPCVDHDFWDLSSVEFKPGAVYLIGREQFNKNIDKIRSIAQQNFCTIVLCNPWEGSWTMMGQIARLGIDDLVKNQRIVIVSGGALPAEYPCLTYDSFLPKILDYEENLKAQKTYWTNWTDNRPYKFLFLNGRARPHRRALLDRLQHLLNQSLWSNLDSANGTVKTLDTNYEFDFYKQNSETATQGYVKHELFNNQWGEIYINSRAYLDTYFSVVTETVFEYPHSFRTEKIWKPIAIGHPWIAVANAGFYRDMRNLGFQTFAHIIDESFDSIDANDQRLERIAQVIEDLCQQDLASFAKECYNVCKYNQQHLAELRIKVRKEFPDRFQQFIQHYANE